MISWSARTTADVLRHCGIDGVGGGSALNGLAAERLRRAPSRGLLQLRGLFRDFWGSTGVGGGSALDGLAAERLRRTPSRGPSEKGTNQNESRSYMHQERRKKKAKRGGARLGWWRDREPGSLPVAYLVTQVGNWGSGSDDVGLIDYICGSTGYVEELFQSTFFEPRRGGEASGLARDPQDPRSGRKVCQAQRRLPR